MKEHTTLLLVLVLGSAVSAAAPAEAPRTAVEILVLNPGKSVIYGTAFDQNAEPLPSASVRLRNLQTRMVEQVSTTNLAGEFVFVALPDIPYVVELADHPGRIIAVGDVIMAPADELASSVLVVPSAGRASTDLFRSTAGALAAAAAGTGMTVVSNAPPLSPEK
jgi:hypothetical protein